MDIFTVYMSASGHIYNILCKLLFLTQYCLETLASKDLGLSYSNKTGQKTYSSEHVADKGWELRYIIPHYLGKKLNICN